MKFVSIRDFGNKAAAIHKALKTEHEIVLTCNGKPFAILVEADEDTFEEKLAVLRRARARAVLDRIRARAKERGLDKLTMEEIDAEIPQAPRERQNGRSHPTV